MILVIESIVLCVLFTIMVYIMSRKPINTLYNYPSKIQERVKSLEEYKDKIPTQKNKIFAQRDGPFVLFLEFNMSKNNRFFIITNKFNRNSINYSAKFIIKIRKII